MKDNQPPSESHLVMGTVAFGCGSASQNCLLCNKLLARHPKWKDKTAPNLLIQANEFQEPVKLIVTSA